MPLINRKYQILMVIFVVLGIFYPAIFAGENSVDDAQLLYGLAETKFDIIGLFSSHGGFYYRPLLMLTYYFDQYFWGGAASFMHLENILLHCANAVFVYFLVLKFVAYIRADDKISPLLASLLFAIHPITTESVNWISGRTDLLASFFVLGSVLVLFVANERRSLLLMLTSSALFICSVMSKEVMVFFLPIHSLLLWKIADYSRKHVLKMIAVFTSPFIILFLVFVVVRMMTAPESSHGVDDLLAKWHYGFYDTFRVSFKVFGFYVKKMFVPVPLNFAIRHVSDMYAPFGLSVMALSVWFFHKKPKTFLPFAIAFWMTVPAIVVALTSVAWTPLAERYIYLSAAFVSVGLAPLMIKVGRSFDHRVGTFLVAVLLLSATSVTAQRNFIWQDNHLLYEDTLRKNPDFAAAHNELGIALVESGQYQEAEAVLTKAISDGFGSENPLLYINLAGIYLGRKDFHLAYTTLKNSFDMPSNANLKVLKMLATVSEQSLLHNEFLGFEGQTEFLLDLVDRYRQIYEKSKDPFHLYRAGQLLLGVKHNQEAFLVFNKVAKIAPEDAFYYPAAKKLSQRLRVEEEFPPSP